MKAEPKTHEQEPIGIVIAHGARRKAAPTFFAYVWAPDPESDDTGTTKAV